MGQAKRSLLEEVPRSAHTLWERGLSSSDDGQPESVAQVYDARDDRSSAPVLWQVFADRVGSS
jgi:hypothetical protein